MTKPDWNVLLPKLVNCIASKLIADDLTDFLRFRAACRPWRSSTEEMRTQADCLYPRNWIMLSNPGPTPDEPVQFYNTFTHKSFLFDLTVYLDQYSVFRTFPRVIILQNKSTQEFALLNPFMRSVTQLPSEIVSDCPNAPAKIDDMMIHDNDVRASPLSDVYVTSSSTIVLWFSGLDCLVWTKKGDQSWAYAEFEIPNYYFPVLYDNRFLVFDPESKGVVQINFGNEILSSQSQPHCEVVIPGLGAFMVTSIPILVDCNGTIFMVTVRKHGDGDAFSFEIYKLDLEKKTCVPSTDLGGCSLFVGCRSFAVSSKNDLIPNCLYYHRILRYNFDTNVFKFWTKAPYLNPNPLVRKLASFSQRVDPVLSQQEDGSIIYYYEDEQEY